MSVLLENFPIKITNKKKIDYEEFIFKLSERANLNTIYKSKIKWEWVEYFSEETEKNIMELDSVRWLYNSI